MLNFILGVGVTWIIWLLYFFKYHMDLSKILAEIGVELDRIDVRLDELEGLEEGEEEED